MSLSRRAPLGFSPDFIQVLECYPGPGNILSFAMFSIGPLPLQAVRRFFSAGICLMGYGFTLPKRLWRRDLLRRME